MKHGKTFTIHGTAFTDHGKAFTIHGALNLIVFLAFTEHEITTPAIFKINHLLFYKD